MFCCTISMLLMRANCCASAMSIAAATGSCPCNCTACSCSAAILASRLSSVSTVAAALSLPLSRLRNPICTRASSFATRRRKSCDLAISCPAACPAAKNIGGSSCKLTRIAGTPSAPLVIQSTAFPRCRHNSVKAAPPALMYSLALTPRPGMGALARNMPGSLAMSMRLAVLATSGRV